MRSACKSKLFNKTILSGAISTALAVSIGLGVTAESHADIYEFSYDGLFTMLDPGGKALQNTSYPYYGDPTWAYGNRTQISGTLSFDTATGAGSGTVAPFNFFSGGPAVASGVVFQSIGAGLMLGNMGFAWNGNDITTQIVLDGSGLFAAIGSGAAAVGTPTFDLVSCDTGGTLDGLCVLPASELAKKGSIPIGPVPIATSSFNTAGQTGVGTVLADLSLGTDDGIGGSPMDNGPFSGFNANFDITSVTVTNFTDTTVPEITLNAHVDPAGTNPLIMTEGGVAYVEPGATCTDGPPLNTDLDASVIIAGTVNTAIGGIYPVTYDCADASNNDATQVIRTVAVVSEGAPLVVLNGLDPVTHECSVPYVDAGAVCADFEDGILEDPDFIKDQTIIDAGIGIAGTYIDSVSWTCQDITDPQPPVVEYRTVDVVDTTAPVIVVNGGDENIVSSTPDNIATYVDLGASVTDSCDLTVDAVTTTNPVDMIVPDTGNETLVYSVKYVASDFYSNTDTKFRTVSVTRSQPVITLVGSAAVPLSVGDTYVEEGMDVADAQDALAPLSAVLTSAANCLGTDSNCSVDSSSVDTTQNGSYEVIYNVTDAHGNKATQVIRTVTVGAFAEGSNFSMLDSSGAVFGGTNDVVFDWDGTSLNTDETDTDFGVHMKISSALPQPFFNFLWTAHHIRVYGPGTYSFDTTCTAAQFDAGQTDCGGSNPITMTVPEDTIDTTYLGGHILFDWGKPDAASPCGVANCDIDVVNVWEVNGVWDQHGDSNPRNQLFAGASGVAPDPTTTWKLVSTDVNGDGINASPMVDGPFQGFYANFNAGPGATAGPVEPLPHAQGDTKLGSSLLASMNISALFASLMMLFGLRHFGRKK